MAATSLVWLLDKSAGGFRRVSTSYSSTLQVDGRCCSAKLAICVSWNACSHKRRGWHQARMEGIRCPCPTLACVSRGRSVLSPKRLIHIWSQGGNLCARFSRVKDGIGRGVKQCGPRRAGGRETGHAGSRSTGRLRCSPVRCAIGRALARLRRCRRRRDRSRRPRAMP